VFSSFLLWVSFWGRYFISQKRLNISRKGGWRTVLVLKQDSCFTSVSFTFHSRSGFIHVHANSGPLQPIYQRDLTKKSTRDFSIDAKKLTLSKHHADPHNPQPAKPTFFSNKERQLGGGAMAAAAAWRRQKRCGASPATAAWWSGSTAAVATTAAAWWRHGGGGAVAVAAWRRELGGGIGSVAGR
jgi:hypothetical protein